MTYRRDSSIHDAFSAQVAATPGRTAVVLPSIDDTPDRRLSYAELDRASGDPGRSLARP